MIRCNIILGADCAALRAGEIESEGDTVISISYAGRRISYGESDLGSAVESFAVFYREAVPVKPISLDPLATSDPYKLKPKPEPTPDYQCSICQRGFDQLEAVHIQHSKVAAECQPKLGTGRLLPYVMRGQPAAPGSLERVITTICWKCWDRSGVTTQELIFLKR